MSGADHRLPGGAARVPLPPGLARNLARELALVVALLAVGVALGGVWAELAPSVARHADLGEARVAVDGTLALLLLVAGVITAVVIALRPGPQPALRLVAALAGSLGGGGLAWLVGHLTGLSVGAYAALLLWALALAVLTALRAVLGVIVSPG